MWLIAYCGLNSGGNWTVNRRSMHSGRRIGSSFSLLSFPLFPDIPHCGVKIDDTKLNSESIIRPIYQLDSLYSINKHITSLPFAVARDPVSTSSSTIRVHRDTRHIDHRPLLCFLWQENHLLLMSCHNTNRVIIPLHHLCFHPISFPWCQILSCQNCWWLPHLHKVSLCVSAVRCRVMSIVRWLCKIKIVT